MKKFIDMIDRYSRLAILVEGLLEIIFYPDMNYRDIETIKHEDRGTVYKSLIKDLKKKQRLLSLMNTFLNQVLNLSNLNAFINQQIVQPLHGLSVPLFEFRIPKKSSEGVIRLYFGYKEKDNNTIIILSAELKHGKIESNREKTKTAEIRYKEKCI